MNINIFEELELGPSINGLVTDGNTKVYCHGFVLALFQSSTVNKIYPGYTDSYSQYATLKY